MEIYTIINIFKIDNDNECTIYNFTNREEAVKAFGVILKKRECLHNSGGVYLESKPYYRPEDKVVSVDDLFGYLLGTGGSWEAYNEDCDVFFIRNEKCDIFNAEDYE